MNKKQKVDSLNEIKDLFETSKTRNINTKDNALLYGEIDGPYPDKFLLVINGRKKIVEFHSKTANIWKNDFCFFNNYTHENFEKRLIKFIRLKVENSELFNFPDYENLKKLSKPETKREIFKEIKGLRITNINPIELKNFTFYSWTKHKDFIESKYLEAFKHHDFYFFNPQKEKTLVSTFITSSDFERSCELADIKFKKLENILKYLLTDTSHSNIECNMHDVGIYNYREQSWLESVEVTEKYISSTSKITGTYKELELTKDLLFNKANNSKEIWEIFNKEKLNKTEQKLLNAIEWIGKAKNEFETEKAFIQFLFAIESLVNYTTNGLISPSVSYHMCETIAFLLGENKNERIELDKTFTRLYSIRSSIVHGNTKEFTKYDLEDAQSISEQLVSKFLNEKNLLNIGIEGIKKQIKELKYDNASR